MKSFLLASGGAAFLALGVLSAVRPAQAVGLYGAYGFKPTASNATNPNTYSDTRVVRINAATSRFEPLTSNVGFYLTDLAVRANSTNPVNDDLFGISISLTTGVQNFISIGSNGVGTSLGTIAGNGGEILTGLGFASIGSAPPVLYAIGGGTGTASATNDTGNLYTITIPSNPVSTITPTLVAAIPGLRASGDIVYDKNNDRFFATSLEQSPDIVAQGGQNNSTDRVLCFKPNGSPCTGRTAQVIGNVGTTDTSSMTGLTIEDGKLYGYNGFKSDRSTSSVSRYLINADTGLASNPQPITYTGTVPGTSGYIAGTANNPGASVPEPSTILGSVMAVGFGALMKVQYSRKRKTT